MKEHRERRKVKEMRRSGKAGRIAAVLLGVLLAVLSVPAGASGTVQYMPDVTKEMSSASYWSDKVGEPQELLADRSGIEQLNRTILEKSNEMTDMAAWTETEYDAEMMVDMLVKRAQDDAAFLGTKYMPDGSTVDYAPLIELCRDPDVYPPEAGGDSSGTEQAGDGAASGTDGEGSAAGTSGDGSGTDAAQMQEYKFAVCTTRTSLTVYPAAVPIQDEKDDVDFDYNYLTQVKVNEPLILRTKSRSLEDGSFYYSAVTMCGEGWIPADCVAICSSKEEWLDAWDLPMDQVLVVLDDKIWTEESNTQPETSKRKLSMGTRLQLATDEESKGQIAGRTAHNNYVVWMPVRKPDGTYEKKLALISETRKVCEGVPDLNAENLMKVALNELGDVYGWGSMLGSDDCSGYIRDVYSCFGLDLPRSSNRNNGAMKSYDLSKMSDEEKASFIKKLPPGTDLMLNGHEMMYLGYEGDRIYVISSAYSMRLPGEDRNTKVLGTVINTLDMCRGDNQTWLHHLYEAMVPFYSADHEDYRVSIKKASVEGVTDRIYNGREQTQTPQVILNGSPLVMGTDYEISYSDNIDVGTALMTVTGTGSYKGSVDTTFRISDAGGNKGGGDSGSGDTGGGSADGGRPSAGRGNVRTGDDNALGAWIALMLAALSGSAGMAFIIRKRRTL